MFGRGFGQGKHRGQVTAEFVVSVMFILLPLMIVVPTLGKYLDAKHKTELGTRYASWERTAWFAEEQNGGYGAVRAGAIIRDQVDHRIFGPRSEAIYTGQVTEDVEAPAFLNHAYGDGSAYQPLIRRQDNRDGFVAASVDEIDTPGWAGGVDRGLSAVGAISGGRFDLGEGGSYTANVSVDVHNPEPIEAFDGFDLEFSRDSALLADGWNVGGPDHNERRVSGLVPTEALDNPATDFLTTKTASVVQIFYPPAEALADLEFGKVDVEPVPPQYLE